MKCHLRLFSKLSNPPALSVCACGWDAVKMGHNEGAALHICSLVLGGLEIKTTSPSDQPNPGWSVYRNSWPNAQETTLFAKVYKHLHTHTHLAAFCFCLHWTMEKCSILLTYLQWIANIFTNLHSLCQTWYGWFSGFDIVKIPSLYPDFQTSLALRAALMDLNTPGSHEKRTWHALGSRIADESYTIFTLTRYYLLNF